jgi:hypothetical protein
MSQNSPSPTPMKPRWGMQMSMTRPTDWPMSSGNTSWMGTAKGCRKGLTKTMATATDCRTSLLTKTVIMMGWPMMMEKATGLRNWKETATDCLTKTRKPKPKD